MEGRSMGLGTPETEVRLDSPPAFRAFYERSLLVVYSYLFHRCGGRTAAEDLTQETFMAAVRELKAGRAVEAPVPWVLGIARHKLLDFYRRQEREEGRLTLAYHAERVSDEAMDVGEASRERTLQALEQVPAAQRAVLVMRYLDGMSVPEVAAAVGKSVHATESLLARGRESFKRTFAGAKDE
jgi:RNA polymerase sigma-70 factor (ECF subfamily)